MEKSIGKILVYVVLLFCIYIGPFYIITKNKKIDVYNLNSLAETSTYKFMENKISD